MNTQWYLQQSNLSVDGDDDSGDYDDDSDDNDLYFTKGSKSYLNNHSY